MKKITILILCLISINKLFSQITYSGGFPLSIPSAALSNQCGSQPLTAGMNGFKNDTPITISSATLVNTMVIPVGSIGQNGLETHSFDALEVQNETVSFSSSCNSLLTLSGINVSNNSATTSVATTITVTSVTPFKRVKITQSGAALVIGPTNTISTSLNKLSTAPDFCSVPYGMTSIGIDNVISNDYYYSSFATFSDVNLNFISSTNSGIALNTATGALTVSSSVPVGSYTLIYQICSKIAPVSCMNGTVTITVTPSVTNKCWSSIASGTGATIAVKSDGTLWSWGSDDYLLGNGSTTNTNVPIQVGVATNWKLVSCADRVAYAIKTDGTLWGWGLNPAGFNISYFPSNIPSQIGNQNDWKSVSAGQEFVVCLKNNGTIWSSGNNNNGQLGIGNTTTTLSLTQIGSDTNWSIISSGYYHVLSIKTDGSLWAWGGNVNGCLGSGISSKVPLQIGSNWKSCNAGTGISQGVKTDGSLWTWGSNAYGQLGNNDYSVAISHFPYMVGDSYNWDKVARSNTSVFAIKNDGTLWSWGAGDVGKLGLGSTLHKIIPTQVGSSMNWKDAVSSNSSSFALKLDGTSYACGNGSAGELGNGTNNNSTAFGQISYCDPLNIIAVSDSATVTNGALVIAIPNVRDNDTYNNTPVTSQNTVLSFVSSSNSGITLNTNTGEVSVASTVLPGTYTLIYQICSLLSQTACATATVTITVTQASIIATSDVGLSTAGIVNNSILNVLANDTYYGAIATTSDVSLSLVSSTNAGVTLNATTGAVGVAANVPVGNYTLIYQICENNNLTNCATATVSITVGIQLDAVDDSGTAVLGLASQIPNVRLNDTYNNLTPSQFNTSLSTVSSSHPGITLNPSNGVVSISALVPAGNQYLVYKLCQTGSTTNCDTATVTIFVGVQTPNIVAGIRANNGVTNIELQSNGKIIITGAFSQYNNKTAINIARLNTNLTIDQTFLSTAPGGFIAENGIAKELVIQPDDKIIIVSDGSMYGFNDGSNGNGIVRLNPDGYVDPGFNVGGTGLSSENEAIRACALQADGKILIGGNFTSYNGVPVKNMIRLNQNGSIDPTFDFPFTNTGIILSATINKIVVQPNGQILVGGAESNFSNGQRGVFRLNIDGSIDSSFAQGNTGLVTWNGQQCASCITAIQNMIIQPDNKIIAVGAFDTYNGANNKNIVRLNPDGSIDSTFSIGTSTDRGIVDIDYELSSGKIYIGGEFSTYNGTAINRLCRLNSNGTLDTTFNIGTGTAHTNSTASPYLYNTVHGIKIQPDGKVIIGGYFTSYNGITAGNITRIQPSVAGGQAKNLLQTWESEPEIDVNLSALNNNVVVYPNPSNGLFNVDLSENNTEFDRIVVYNVLGKEIFTNTIISKSNNQIDLSALPTGYYIARIFNGEDSVQVKLIKR